MAQEEIKKTKLAIIEEMRAKGIQPYPYKYEPTATSVELHEKYDRIEEGETVDDVYKVAGRIKARRGFGKLIFLQLDDYIGNIQVCVKSDETPEEDFELVNKYIDVGDIIGVEGRMFKTKKGELSVMAKNVVILSKSMMVLPEKWHGLTDSDERFRKRYLDLIMNPETRANFEIRFKAISFIRRYMEGKGYNEVDIPMLQQVYGGAFAKPFTSHSHAWDSDLFLSISPELHLKRLLVGGMKNVFTIARCFRNEDVDRWHNPEFTIMEAYAQYKDYNDMMELAEDMISSLVEEVCGKTEIEYQGTKISFERPWARITFKDALNKYAEIDFDKTTDAELKRMLDENEIQLPVYNRGLALTELFEKHCEDKFINPTFVIDYPVESTPLCKQHRKDPRLVERFELMVKGIEIANAYSELNDPVVQRRLLEEQVEVRKLRGEYQPVDYDFIESLEYGMPPAGGIGFGIDRLIVLLTNSQSIKEVILFPQLRPKIV